METGKLDARVAALEPQIIRWRRWLHAHAERSFEEHETTRYLFDALSQMDGVAIERPTKTGLVARIHGTKAGTPATIGVRADIDALPMPEENDLPYRAIDPHVMHACGHDGHAAMLLGLAFLLSGARETFCGEARLFFQHAEELPPGGAIEMVRAGAADGVDAMLGLHLTSLFDTGVFGIRSGVLTAAVDRFDVVLNGKGGHCAFPEQCSDPVVTACELVLALQSVVSRRVAASEPAVLSVCRIHGGTAYNIIPDAVTISASVRSFGEETRRLIEREARRIADGVSSAHGCTARVDWVSGYPSVVNDADLAALAEARIRERFGAARALSIERIMPGEDYAYFLDGRPGFFVELGTRNADTLCDFPHHNPRYRMDEDALILGVQYQLDMVLSLLDGTRRRLGA